MDYRDKLLNDMFAFNKYLIEDIKEKNARVEELKAALQLAYRALTEGKADVPPGEHWRKCAELRVRVAAKRAILAVLREEVR